MSRSRQVMMDTCTRATFCALLALAASCNATPETKADTTATTVPAVAAPVRPVPYFVGEEGHDPTAAGREATVSKVKGTATWAIERDPLDLRRKVTIRIVLNTPTSTLVVLRTIDSLAPAPGYYSFIIPSTGAAHHAPRTIHGDTHITDAGRTDEYILGALDVDSLRIDTATVGATDSTLRGRIRLRGMAQGDASANTPLRDIIYHNVIGNFIAPPAGTMSPGDFVTPAMQEAVLRRALDGFIIANTEAAANGVDGIDSTAISALARPYLENRWGAAAVVEEAQANGMTHYVRLRGRFVPTVCEVSSRDSRIVCH